MRGAGGRGGGMHRSEHEGTRASCPDHMQDADIRLVEREARAETSIMLSEPRAHDYCGRKGARPQSVHFVLGYNIAYC